MTVLQVLGVLSGWIVVVLLLIDRFSIIRWVDAKDARNVALLTELSEKVSALEVGLARVEERVK